MHSGAAIVVHVLYVVIALHWRSRVYVKPFPTQLMRIDMINFDYCDRCKQQRECKYQSDL